MTDASGQRCGTCRWYREVYSNGDCEYPLPQWVKFVLSHAYNNVFPHEILAPFTVRPDEGKDCPTWQAK